MLAFAFLFFSYNQHCYQKGKSVGVFRLLGIRKRRQAPGTLLKWDSSLFPFKDMLIVPRQHLDVVPCHHFLWCRRMPIRGELGFDQRATLTAPARQKGSTQLQLEKQLLHYIPYSWIINLQLWSIWVVIKCQGGNAFNCFRKESLGLKSGQWMTLEFKRKTKKSVLFSFLTWITQIKKNKLVFKTIFW